MNEWIDCKLPWRVRLNWPVTEPFPDMEPQIKAHFGATKAEWEERFYPGMHTDGIGFMTDHPIFKEYQQIRDTLEEEFSEEEVKQKLQLNPNVAVQTVLACRGICKEIDAWAEAQPEWIAACEAHDAAWKAHKEEEAKYSFCGKNLNQAGTVIEYQEEDQLHQMMIGTINELGGSCDDCRGISDETIILRYKVLWNGQDSQTNTQ
jgi:hypothetical protein